MTMKEKIMDINTYIQQYPYQAYSYSYPHKNSYRQLDKPLALHEAWQQESLSSLFLYLHIPFCEMRCGFCNLFTLANPQEELIQAYLDALLIDIKKTAESLDGAQFARLALGGGTPSLMSASQIDQLFSSLANQLLLDTAHVPTSFEVSPYTAKPDKIKLLKQIGVERISIGIQSFIEEETKQIGRHQPPAQLNTALENIKEQNFTTLNLDLIYGIPGQTEMSWKYTLEQTLRYAPQEIYLYPLYIRPLTGIGKRDLKNQQTTEDTRKRLYRIGRDYLFEQGYEQLSLRMFRKRGLGEESGPVYSCQEDGMLGLGVGARSYTSQLHYSSRYAVSRRGVTEIVNDYVESIHSGMAPINYGFELNKDDQHRRYLILSLLSSEGIKFDLYQNRFKTELLQDFPELEQLVQHQFAKSTSATMALTQKGLEYSDSIGPWLYSGKVNSLSNSCDVQ